MPMFFIGLLSRTLGWVPSCDQICKEKQDLLGLSLIEMEMIHGAYMTNNPNGMSIGCLPLMSFAVNSLVFSHICIQGFFFSELFVSRTAKKLCRAS